MTVWAHDVVNSVPDGIELPDTPAWRMQANKPGAMVEPIFTAHRCTTWPKEVNEKIAAAMQTWHGPGRVDGVTGEHLKDHRKINPGGGPKRPGQKKAAGPPRIV